MWPELSAKLAMRFGRAPILEDVDAESFARFAEDAGLALPFLRRRAAAMAAGIHGAIVDGIEVPGLADMPYLGGLPATVLDQIGRASCRERVCQYGQIQVGAVSLQQNKHPNTTQTIPPH